MNTEAAQPAVKPEGVTPDEQKVLSESFQESVGKIAEGHQQVADARRVPEDTLRLAVEATERLHLRLHQDMRVLVRYGHTVPEEVEQMHADALLASKVAVLALQTLQALQGNE